MKRGVPIVLLCCALLAAGGGRARAQATAALLAAPAGERPAGQLEALQLALAAALGRLPLEVTDAATAGRRLAADPAATAQRERAAGELARVDELRRHMRYDEAHEALARAEADAVAGLARLVAPRLLAELALQRGLVLLSTDAARARQSLRRSFALHPWPFAELEARHSPKVAEELRRIAAEPRGRETAARAAPLHGISVAESRRAAAVLGARYLVSPCGDAPRVCVQLFDAQRGAWRRIDAGPQQAHAAPGSAAVALEARLRAALGVPAPAPAPVRRAPLPVTRKPRRVPPQVAGPRRWPWIAAGAGVAAATAVGIALWAVSSDRLSAAEALAGRSPPLEYADRAEGHEDAARHLRAGAAVSFAIAGATLATAAACYLWHRERGPKRRAGGLRLGGWGLAFSFP